MDDSKSFEKKLDRDFLFYLNLTKNLFQNMKDEEKQLCEVWLTHLLGKSISTLAEKCDRNIYLSRLLLQMQNSKLTEVFLETPPSGALPSAFETFRFPTEVDGLKGFEELGFQIDSNIGGGDFFETSTDGRTYLATRHLPQGIMAYMAVTNNEGEPVWVPQSTPSRPGTAEGRPGPRRDAPEGFVKYILEHIDVPLSELRKTPEEREEVLEWMDKLIHDCNRWIQGEDPHNMELEGYFRAQYNNFKKDPEKSEIIKHPRVLRSVIFREIRDQIARRRDEMIQREMVLDQYESKQYSEKKTLKENIDSVWFECATKPLNETVKAALDAVYPYELVERFISLLVNERMIIIERGERYARKKIAELRKTSIEDTTKELQKLQKAKEDYKEYYCVYKDVEEKFIEFEKEWKEKCVKTDKMDQKALNKFKQDMELEIQRARRDFDKERRTQHDLQEKLDEAKEQYKKVKGRIDADVEKLVAKKNEIRVKKEDVGNQITVLKQRKIELQCKIASKKNRC